MIQKRTKVSVAGALLAAAFAGPANAQDVPAPDHWGPALREDAQSIHDAIAASHPGYVDAANPTFRGVLEEGLTLALARAETAQTYADWYFALNEYTAAFNDGHLGLTGYARMNHSWQFQWPGFLTAERDGETRVVYSADPSGPPVSAILQGCDGRSPEVLAGEVLGRNAGRWNLRSRRVQMSPYLMFDQTNPYVARPRECAFTFNGRAEEYTLIWRPFPRDLQQAALTAAQDQRFTSPIELRRFAGQAAWIGLGSFDTEPRSEPGRQLQALKGEVERDVSSLRAAPVVVFDLRGNNGGSSAWITSLANTLWGDRFVAQAARSADYVEWRASPENLEKMIAYRPSLGAQPETAAWLEMVISGLQSAIAAGEPLWRQPADEIVLTDEQAAINPVAGRVFVFTDYDCGSACLDAVDLLKALGAVHVGQETNADTTYLETRQDAMPSGRAELYLPMKVYRGRPRGSNEPAVPDHAWRGALSDTAGIEAWIRDLARRP